MKMIKRELFLCLMLTAFVFVCALAWGHPFFSANTGAPAAYLQQVQSSRFQGTVLQNGQQFLLRDSSGQNFHLESAQSVQSFDGKRVSITGKLDAASKTIHVEQIDSSAL